MIAASWLDEPTVEVPALVELTAAHRADELEFGVEEPTWETIATLEWKAVGRVGEFDVSDVDELGGEA